MITLLPETPVFLDTPQAMERDGLNRCLRCNAIKPGFLGCDCLLWAFWDAGEFEAAINPAKWENWDWETDSPLTDTAPLLSGFEHTRKVTIALNETSMAVWAKNFADAAEKIAVYMLNTWYPGVDSCYVYIKAPTEESPVKYKAVRRVKVEIDLEGTPQTHRLPRFPRNWQFSGVNCGTQGNHVLGGCIICSDLLTEPEPPATGTSPLDSNLDNVPDVFRKWPHSDEDLRDL
jgi:hypothetical protein